MTKRRSLEELTLLDRFLFAETMEDPENLRILLEIILGKDLVLKHLQIASLNGHLCHIWRPACDLNGGQPRTH